MNAIDIIIIVILMLMVIGAIWYYRKGSHKCCGSCNGCNQKCSKRKEM